MSPQEIAALTALVKLLVEIGVWPPLILLIGPWVLAVVLMWMIEKSQARRLRAVQNMYENNAALVEKFAETAEALKTLAEDQQGFMVGNTQALTELVASINMNQYCPLVRTEKKKVEVSA